jgi:uncharacterized membrane protein YidH (DUF202 family)
MTARQDKGLAYERTVLAWTRTALSFAAVGGVIVKTHVVTGLVVVALAPVVWQLGRYTRGGARRAGLITLMILLVAAVALIVAAGG